MPSGTGIGCWRWCCPGRCSAQTTPRRSSPPLRSPEERRGDPGKAWHPTALAELDEIPDDPLDTSTLSRDDAVGAVYSADPLVWHGPFKRPMLRSIARTLEVINHGGDPGDLPTLWVHGEADTLVPIGPSREGIERLRGTDLTEIIYPEARHEVFNETNQDAVLDDVIEFARRRVESADLV